MKKDYKKYFMLVSFLFLSLIVFSLVTHQAMASLASSLKDISKEVGPNLKEGSILISCHGEESCITHKKVGEFTFLIFIEEGKNVKAIIFNKEFSNVRKKDEKTDAFIKLNSNGEIVGINLTTLKGDTTYEIKNDKISIPPNSRLVLEEDIFKIFIPKNGIFLKAPSLIDPAKNGRIIEIKGENIRLPKGNILNEGTITYQNGKPFIKSKDYAIINNFKIEVLDKSVELDFFGKTEKKDNYIKISPERIESSGQYFSIEFSPGKFIEGEKYVLNPYIRYLSLDYAKNKRYFYLRDGGKVGGTCADNCQHVKLIQKLVGVKQDGVYNENTMEAVKTWQKKNGIVVNGKFGKESLQTAMNKDKTRKIKILHENASVWISKNGKVNLKFQGELILEVGSRTFVIKDEKIKRKIEKNILENVEVPVDLTLISLAGEEKERFSLDDPKREMISTSVARRDSTITWQTVQMATRLVNSFLFRDKKSIEEMQNKFNNIGRKIERKEKLTNDEIRFLKDFYYTLAYGGIISGAAPEAGSLLKHYLEGSGKNVEISPQLYQTSSAFRNAQILLIEEIKKDVKRRPLTGYETREINSRILKNQKFEDDGGITKEGWVLTEITNPRLKMVNNKYLLSAKYTLDENDPKNIKIEWSVIDEYFFKDPEDAPGYATPFKFRDVKLIVPHAVSRALTEYLGAKPFFTITKFTTSARIA